MGELTRLTMAYSVAAIILSIFCIGVVHSAGTGKVVQGWKVPASWEQGSDYVVVKTSSGANSQYGGYIFPGPSALSASSVNYSSPDGYLCEAKHYDHNYGIFETQECANKWTKLISLGDSADVSVADCKLVASRPCGCQGLCRPVACTQKQIKNTGIAGEEGCNYYSQCRRQEELGLVTSCAETAVFQVSM